MSYQVYWQGNVLVTKEENRIMSWVQRRLSEKSTWRGLILALSGLGISLSPEMAEQVISLGLMIGGLFEVTTKDEKR